MKKAFALFISLVVIALCLTGCGTAEKGQGYQIGISQYGEHASLDNCRIGFLEGLKEEGIVEGENLTVHYQNCNFDDSMTVQIAQNFAARSVDLMCGIATPAAQACFAAAEDKNIPVIFTAVNDPAASKLDSGNVTGSSDRLPVDAQLDLIRKLMPDAKTIGIIYTTSESNSVSTIEDYKDKAGKYGFTIVEKGVTQQSEVTLAVDSLLAEQVDCFSNLTDNTVVGVLDAILEKTDAKGIPVFGSEVEQVKKGCVASAGIDYVELGKRTGKLAAQVLKGEKKAGEIPFITITDFNYYTNSEALAGMGLKVPQEILEKAIESAS